MSPRPSPRPPQWRASPCSSSTTSSPPEPPLALPPSPCVKPVPLSSRSSPLPAHTALPEAWSYLGPPYIPPSLNPLNSQRTEDYLFLRILRDIHFHSLT